MGWCCHVMSIDTVWPQDHPSNSFDMGSPAVQYMWSMKLWTEVVFVDRDAGGPERSAWWPSFKANINKECSQIIQQRYYQKISYLFHRWCFCTSKGVWHQWPSCGTMPPCKHGVLQLLVRRVNQLLKSKGKKNSVLQCTNPFCLHQDVLAELSTRLCLGFFSPRAKRQYRLVGAKQPAWSRNICK